MSRQMPGIDVGLHYGAQAGFYEDPIDKAEGEFREKENPTPHQVRQFRTGYVVGQINGRLDFLQRAEKFLSRDELKELLEDLQPIAEKWGYKP